MGPGGGSRPKSGMDYKVPSLEGQYDRGAKALLRISKMALGYPWHCIVAVISVIAAGIFQLLIPLFLGDAVDNATGLLESGQGGAEEVKSALVVAAGLIIGAAVLWGGFTMMHNYLGEAIGQHLAYQLRLAYFEKLQRLSFSYHDRIHSGDLLTRGMLDIEGIRRFIEIHELDDPDVVEGAHHAHQHSDHCERVESGVNGRKEDIELAEETGEWRDARH